MVQLATFEASARRIRRFRSHFTRTSWAWSSSTSALHTKIFELYFLAFDHSDGKDSAEDKKKNKLGREGILELCVELPELALS
jgi:hypothetical protein